MKLVTAPLRIFHERDAWQSFSLSHTAYEHVICLELGQGVSSPVHHQAPVRRASRATRHAEWATISEWYVCRVVHHPRGVSRRFRSSQGSWCSRFTRNTELFCLICVSDCSTVTSEAARASSTSHHHQRRLPRPRDSTRFLQSFPSFCEEKSPFQV